MLSTRRPDTEPGEGACVNQLNKLASLQLDGACKWRLWANTCSLIVFVLPPSVNSLN